MPIFDKKKSLPMIKFWKTVKPIHCKLLNLNLIKTNSDGYPYKFPRCPPEKFSGSQS